MRGSRLASPRVSRHEESRTSNDGGGMSEMTASLGSFTHRQPTKVHFGAGRLIECGRIARRYGGRCLLVSTSANEAAMAPLYERVKSILSAAGVETIHFDGVVANPTTAAVEAGIQMARSNGADLVMAVGGGSSIDTAKAVSIFGGLSELDWTRWFSVLTDPFEDYVFPSSRILPVIAMTTTSGTGSHVTQAMVISDPAKGEKNCIFHPAAFPREAIVDPELMLSLPAGATAVTGFDAFSHAFESCLSERASVFTSLLAEEALRIIAATLPAVVARPDDIALRSRMAWADTLAGISLANTGAGIPHPLSELVGGIRPDLPHGACLASLYPAYIAFLSAKPNGRVAHLVSILAEATGLEPPWNGDDGLRHIVLYFLKAIGLNRRLSEMSLTREDLDGLERHPLLDVLPWASKAELVEVLRASF